MKTVEEKAKAYDEIIIKAKKMHNENCDDCKACIEELISELAESEDEKIRKEIIIYLNNVLPSCSEQLRKYITYLEKQGEQKSIECIKDEALSKLLNKVICHFINNPDIPYSERDEVSFWLIPYVEKLEKQGEQKVIILKFRVGDVVRNKKTDRQFYVHNISKEGFLCLSDMNKKVFQGYLSETDYDNYELVEQKPVEWSDEDEYQYNSCINSIQRADYFSYDALNWLKSLKERYCPQKIYNVERNVKKWKPSEE